jgi:hypothetical protein
MAAHTTASLLRSKVQAWSERSLADREKDLEWSARVLNLETQSDPTKSLSEIWRISRVRASRITYS